jgi:hypothetical protein
MSLARRIFFLVLARVAVLGWNRCCRSPKLGRARLAPARSFAFSIPLTDQWFVTEIDQHRMVLIVEPTTEDIETAV